MNRPARLVRQRGLPTRGEDAAEVLVPVLRVGVGPEIRAPVPAPLCCPVIAVACVRTGGGVFGIFGAGRAPLRAIGWAEIAPCGVAPFTNRFCAALIPVGARSAVRLDAVGTTRRASPGSITR